MQIEISSGPSNEPAGQYCLDWCTSKQLPQMLVVGCGKENHAVIFSLDQNSKWVAGDILGQHSDLIRDVAWAPSMGR